LPIDWDYVLAIVSALSLAKVHRNVSLRCPRMNAIIELQLHRIQIQRNTHLIMFKRPP